MVHVPGDSRGGCSSRQRTTTPLDGVMRSSLAFRASWKGIDPPIALVRRYHRYKMGFAGEGGGGGRGRVQGKHPIKQEKKSYRPANLGSNGTRDENKRALATNASSTPGNPEAKNQVQVGYIYCQLKTTRDKP